MLRFSQDPQAADKQMKAVIFYLTTFGYIDGDFDASEKTFVRDYITKLVQSRVYDAVPAEEGVSDASAAEALHESPQEQVNRPQQEDFDPAEREQYQQPIAEADRPEDR